MALGIVGGLLRKAGGGVSVVTYATIADLNTAAEGTLPAGYYSVPGVGITYWDGAVFEPSLEVIVYGADNTYAAAPSLTDDELYMEAPPLEIVYFSSVDATQPDQADAPSGTTINPV
jgi:hypothetical protein